MSKYFIAIGVGYTAWAIYTHQPAWVVCLNVALDALLILGYVRNQG